MLCPEDAFPREQIVFYIVHCIYSDSMNRRLPICFAVLTIFRMGNGQAWTTVFDTILSAHKMAPYCPDYYEADENFIACCSYNDLLTSGIGPGHVTLPACCWEAATCTGAAPPMYDWTIVKGNDILISILLATDEPR